MAKDPLFNLKYIAFCRSQLPPDEESKTDAAILDYAKWQICKERSVLFNDPKWDLYTPEEILIEYFTIAFDQNEQLREEFLSQIRGINCDDIAWFEQMEKEYIEKKQAEAKEMLGGKEEIEDVF